MIARHVSDPGSGVTGDLIRLDGVARRLGHHWALRGVTLRVAAGERVAIAGHNGSGKTTLLRVIATALTPSLGDGSVLGHDLRRDADGVRRVTALLAHSGGTYGALTARENLAFVLRMSGHRVDGRVADALAWAGLDAAADLRVATYSSGMQRRLALAAVRLRAPRLLLMDEPYNSVDDAGAALVDELIAGVTRAGGAALVALHDIARSGADFTRIVTLREGRIAADARTGREPPHLVLAGAR